MSLRPLGSEHRPVNATNVAPSLARRESGEAFELRDSAMLGMQPPDYRAFDPSTERLIERQPQPRGARGRAAYATFGVSPLRPPEPNRLVQWYRERTYKEKVGLLAGAALVIIGAAVGIGVGVHQAQHARANKTSDAFTTTFSIDGTLGFDVLDDRALGDAYRCGFSGQAIANEASGLRMTLLDMPVAGKAFGCAQLQKQGLYGYGNYTFAVRPLAQAGVTTSLVLYAETQAGLSQEIDLSFYGRNTTELVAIAYQDNKPSEQRVALNFDAATGFHNFAIQWAKSGITWFADGNAVATQTSRLPRYARRTLLLSTWLGQPDAPANGYANDTALPPPGSSQWFWLRYDKAA